MLDRALQHAREHRQESEQALLEFLAIPSVSALARHRADVVKAGDWVAERLRRMGMSVEVESELGLPVIAAEWLKQPGAPTLAIYGHYDVQPPDPMGEWQTPPFEPAVREGFVYARGATDDKGQLLAGMMGAEAAFAAGGPPINLRFLIEGEEEITGSALPSYLARNAARLETDYLFIADGLFTAPGLPNIVTGLRGGLFTEIVVKGAAADLHSGLYGGVAPNPMNSLAHIISGLKGRDGRVTIPGFYDAVQPPSDEELRAWRELPVSEDSLKQEMGASALEGELDFTPLERISSRPTLDVHGIIGGFVEEGFKTVIPAAATAKVSMRLVPDQDPAAILQALRGRVTELATPGVTVEVRDLGQAKPVLCGADHPGVAAAARAFEAAFGAKPVLLREGGSIPVVTEFQELLGPRLLVSGFGLPGDGLHSPNERFSLDQFHRGAEMVIHLMQELAGAGRR